MELKPSYQYRVPYRLSLLIVPYGIETNRDLLTIEKNFNF